MTHTLEKRGFTILETVIYIALFSLLMTGIIVTVYELLEGGMNNREAVAIQEEGGFINRKLSWALSGATFVDVDPDGKSLTITRPDLGGQSPLVFSEDVGEMRIARGSLGVPTPLTTSELKVENTEISIIPPHAGMPTRVSVHYTINGVPFEFKTYLRDF